MLREVKTLWLLLLMGALGACGEEGALEAPDALGVDLEDASVALDPPAPRFEGEIQPILRVYCGACHTTQGAGRTNFALEYAENLAPSRACPGETIGACSLEMVLDGRMPRGRTCVGDPELDRHTPGCLGEAQIDALAEWVEAGMPR